MLYDRLLDQLMAHPRGEGITGTNTAAVKPSYPL